jgi:hypothetical protein
MKTFIALNSMSAFLIPAKFSMCKISFAITRFLNSEMRGSLSKQIIQLYHALFVPAVIRGRLLWFYYAESALKP